MDPRALRVRAAVIFSGGAGGAGGHQRARPVDEEPIAVNWINNVVRPKIRGLLSSTTKREVPDNLWVKCPESGQMVFYKDLGTITPVLLS